MANSELSELSDISRSPGKEGERSFLLSYAWCQKLFPVLFIAGNLGCVPIHAFLYQARIFLSGVLWDVGDKVIISFSSVQSVIACIAVWKTTFFATQRSLSYLVWCQVSGLWMTFFSPFQLVVTTVLACGKITFLIPTFPLYWDVSGNWADSSSRIDHAFLCCLLITLCADLNILSLPIFGRKRGSNCGLSIQDTKWTLAH